jgi:hypothetical protein
VPDVTSSYYLERDVLDYGEMTSLGFDSLVRDVMQMEGGRLAIYDELNITPPSNPTKKKERQGKSLELREVRMTMVSKHGRAQHMIAPYLTFAVSTPTRQF